MSTSIPTLIGSSELIEQELPHSDYVYLYSSLWAIVKDVVELTWIRVIARLDLVILVELVATLVVLAEEGHGLLVVLLQSDIRASNKSHN